MANDSRATQLQVILRAIRTETSVAGKRKAVNDLNGWLHDKKNIDFMRIHPNAFEPTNWTEILETAVSALENETRSKAKRTSRIPECAGLVLKILQLADTYEIVPTGYVMSRKLLHVVTSVLQQSKPNDDSEEPFLKILRYLLSVPHHADNHLRDESVNILDIVMTGLLQFEDASESGIDEVDISPLYAQVLYEWSLSHYSDDSWKEIQYVVRAIASWMSHAHESVSQRGHAVKLELSENRLGTLRWLCATLSCFLQQRPLQIVAFLRDETLIPSIIPLLSTFALRGLPPMSPARLQVTSMYLNLLRAFRAWSREFGIANGAITANDYEALHVEQVFKQVISTSSVTLMTPSTSTSNRNYQSSTTSKFTGMDIMLEKARLTPNDYKFNQGELFKYQWHDRTSASNLNRFESDESPFSEATNPLTRTTLLLAAELIVVKATQHQKQDTCPPPLQSVSPVEVILSGMLNSNNLGIAMELSRTPSTLQWLMIFNAIFRTYPETGPHVFSAQQESISATKLCTVLGAMVSLVTKTMKTLRKRRSGKSSNELSTLGSAIRCFMPLAFSSRKWMHTSDASSEQTQKVHKIWGSAFSIIAGSIVPHISNQETLQQNERVLIDICIRCATAMVSAQLVPNKTIHSYLPTILSLPLFDNPKQVVETIDLHRQESIDSERNDNTQDYLGTNETDMLNHSESQKQFTLPSLGFLRGQQSKYPPRAMFRFVASLMENSQLENIAFTNTKVSAQQFRYALIRWVTRWIGFSVPPRRTSCSSGAEAQMIQWWNALPAPEYRFELENSELVLVLVALTTGGSNPNSNDFLSSTSKMTQHNGSDVVYLDANVYDLDSDVNVSFKFDSFHTGAMFPGELGKRCANNSLKMNEFTIFHPLAATISCLIPQFEARQRKASASCSEPEIFAVGQMDHNEQLRSSCKLPAKVQTRCEMLVLKEFLGLLNSVCNQICALLEWSSLSDYDEQDGGKLKQYVSLEIVTYINEGIELCLYLAHTVDHWSNTLLEESDNGTSLLEIAFQLCNVGVAILDRTLRQHPIIGMVLCKNLTALVRTNSPIGEYVHSSQQHKIEKKLRDICVGIARHVKSLASIGSRTTRMQFEHASNSSGFVDVTQTPARFGSQHVSVIDTSGDEGSDDDFDDICVPLFSHSESGQGRKRKLNHSSEYFEAKKKQSTGLMNVSLQRQASIETNESPLQCLGTFVEAVFPLTDYIGSCCWIVEFSSAFQNNPAEAISILTSLFIKLLALPDPQSIDLAVRVVQSMISFITRDHNLAVKMAQDDPDAINSIILAVYALLVRKGNGFRIHHIAAVWLHAIFGVAYSIRRYLNFQLTNELNDVLLKFVRVKKNSSKKVKEHTREKCFLHSHTRGLFLQCLVLADGLLHPISDNPNCAIPRIAVLNGLESGDSVFVTDIISHAIVRLQRAPEELLFVAQAALPATILGGLPNVIPGVDTYLSKQEIIQDRDSEINFVSDWVDDTIVPNLKSSERLMERAGLLTLVEIAIKWPEFVPRVLFRLCVAASRANRNTEAFALHCRLIHILAVELQVGSTKALFHEYQCFIVSHWLKWHDKVTNSNGLVTHDSTRDMDDDLIHANPWISFPTKAFGYDNVSEFVQDNSPILLVFGLLSSETSADKDRHIQVVANAQECIPPKICGRVVAMLSLLKHCSTEVKRQALLALEHLEQRFPGGVWARLEDSAMSHLIRVSVLFDVLYKIRDVGTPFSCVNAENGKSWLLDTLGSTSFESSLDSVCYVRILVHLRALFDLDTRPDSQTMILKLVVLLCKWIGPRVAETSMARIVATLALRAIQRECCSRYALRLLKLLNLGDAPVDASRGTGYLVSSYLQSVISIDKEKAKELFNFKPDRHCEEFVNYLKRDGENHSWGRLFEVPKVSPDYSNLASPLQHFLERHRNGWVGADSLRILPDLAGPVCLVGLESLELYLTQYQHVIAKACFVGLEQQGVQLMSHQHGEGANIAEPPFLTEFLHTPHHLVQDARSNDQLVGASFPPELVYSLYVSLTRVVGALLELCEASLPHNVRIAASKCIMLLSRCGFSISDRDRAVPKVHHQQRGSTAKSNHEETLDLDKQTLVNELYMYMVHDDYKVAVCATITLANMLQTRSGKEAIKNRDDCTDTFLNANHRRYRSLSEVWDVFGEFADLCGAKLAAPMLVGQEYPWPGINSKLAISAETWICQASAKLSQCIGNTKLDDMMNELEAMCLIDRSFAQMAFPLLLHCCAFYGEMNSGGHQYSRGSMAEYLQIHEWFRNVLSTSNDRSSENFATYSDQLLAIRTVLHALTVLRKRDAESRSMFGGISREGEKQISRTPFVIEIDPLLVGQAALQCDMPSTALLAAELWSEGEFGIPSLSKQQSEFYGISLNEDTSNRSKLRSTTHTQTASRTSFRDSLRELDGALPRHQQIMIQAYEAIGDQDALRGFNKSMDLSRSTDTLRHEKRWNGALIAYDGLLMHMEYNKQHDMAETQRVSNRMAEVMREVGLYHTMESLMSHRRVCETSAHNETFSQLGEWQSMETSNAHNNPITSAVSSEVAWRHFMLVAEDSDAEANSSSLDLQQDMSDVHSYVYRCLRAISRNHESEFEASIQAAQRILLNRASQATRVGEPFRDTARLLVEAQLFEELRSAWVVRNNELNDGENDKLLRVAVQDMCFRDLNLLNSAGNREFVLSELLSALRCSTTNVMRLAQKERSSISGSMLQEVFQMQLLSLAQLNRTNGRPLVSANFLNLLRSDLAHTSDGQAESSAIDLMFLKWRIEEAQTAWSVGELGSAIQAVKGVIKALDTNKRRGVANLHPAHVSHLLVSLKCLAGQWLSHESSEDSKTVQTEYFDEAISLLQQVSEKKEHSIGTCGQLRHHCHLAYAKYVDSLYRGISSRISTDEWQKYSQLVAAKEVEVASLAKEIEKLKNTVGNSARSAKQHLNEVTNIMKKKISELMVERQEYQQVTKAHEVLLLTAVEQYCLGLTYSTVTNGLSSLPISSTIGTSHGDSSSAVFRLLALWFEHQDFDEVNKLVYLHTCDENQENHALISTYHFLPLLYQIVSRIGKQFELTERQDAAAEFQFVLEKLLYRMGVDHPFHMIPQLFALQNTDKIPKEQLNSKFVAQDGSGKVEKATQLLERLKRTKSKFGKEEEHFAKVIDNMNRQYDSLFALASVVINRRKLSTHSFRNCKEYMMFHNYDATLCPVPTAHIPIRPNGDYLNIKNGFDNPVVFLTERKFGKTFTLTETGINSPKVLTCLGSDGEVYKMLVKGRDDLRQDAVMEQLFEIVNGLLQANLGTRERGLKLRTYKVIPISPTSGMIEWVENTVPIGKYLYGDFSGKSSEASVHARKGPASDWSLKSLVTMLKNEFERSGSTKDSKFEKFLECCRHYTPCFHHFFLEYFPMPADWYERRLAYTQSVAVNSMVGYVLGIGDRHTHNILIDLRTAELVHIDFGITFEQGKTLKTPEKVPFRLTREIVNGMGAMHTNGVFDRCCEVTLSVLRSQSAALLTVCEVLLHDPLYKWTVSPLSSSNDRQNGSDRAMSSKETEAELLSDKCDSNRSLGMLAVKADQNQEAQRAIMRLRQKLKGYEDPNGDALNVSGQVKKLVAEAQDPRNLCEMFYGWIPFL